MPQRRASGFFQSHGSYQLWRGNLQATRQPGPQDNWRVKSDNNKHNSPPRQEMQTTLDLLALGFSWLCRKRCDQGVKKQPNFKSQRAGVEERGGRTRDGGANLSPFEEEG